MRRVEQSCATGSSLARPHGAQASVRQRCPTRSFRMRRLLRPSINTTRALSPMGETYGGDIVQKTCGASSGAMGTLLQSCSRAFRALNGFNRAKTTSKNSGHVTSLCPRSWANASQSPGWFSLLCCGLKARTTPEPCPYIRAYAVRHVLHQQQVDPWNLSTRLS